MYRFLKISHNSYAWVAMYIIDIANKTTLVGYDIKENKNKRFDRPHCTNYYDIMEYIRKNDVSVLIDKTYNTFEEVTADHLELLINV